MDLRAPPLKHQNMFESNPLNSKLLVGELAVLRVSAVVTMIAGRVLENKLLMHRETVIQASMHQTIGPISGKNNYEFLMASGQQGPSRATRLI